MMHVEQLVFGRTKNPFACVSDFKEAARACYKGYGYQEIRTHTEFSHSRERRTPPTQDGRVRENDNIVDRPRKRSKGNTDPLPLYG